MEVTAVLVVMTAIFVWGTFSARLTRSDLTAPIAFVAVGALLGALDLIAPTSAPETLKPLVEVTLVWVLFSDAARVPARQFRRELGRYARLLGIGLPLTVLAGWVLAAWLFPGLGVWLALLVGAALAPTDAALGVPVVTNPVVPAPVRRLITVESGLNDGIVTPVVMLAIAAAASAVRCTLMTCSPMGSRPAISSRNRYVPIDQRSTGSAGSTGSKTSSGDER